jgi:hypothetical protein
MTAARRTVAALALLAALAATGVPTFAADGATRRALAELKALCDRGLVAPDVCREKQRAILSLPAAPAPEPSAGDGRAAAARAESAARGYTSPLGFHVTLPPGWTPVTPDTMRSGFATLRQQIDHGGATAALLDRVERQTLAGTTDFFAHGRDHVQVQRAPAPPPTDPVALARFCARLEATATEAAGRPLSTQACAMRLVAGAPTLYVERDALLPGMHTMQYWVPAPHGRAVVFVLSCSQPQSDPCRRDLETLIASLAWQG